MCNQSDGGSSSVMESKEAYSLEKNVRVGLQQKEVYILKYTDTVPPWCVFFQKKSAHRQR